MNNCLSCPVRTQNRKIPQQIILPYISWTNLSRRQQEGEASKNFRVPFAFSIHLAQFMIWFKAPTGALALAHHSYPPSFFSGQLRDQSAHQHQSLIVWVLAFSTDTIREGRGGTFPGGGLKGLDFQFSFGERLGLLGLRDFGRRRLWGRMTRNARGWRC